MFLKGQFILCVSTEIIEEYSEIISKKTTSEIGVLNIVLHQSEVCIKGIYYIHTNQHNLIFV